MLNVRESPVKDSILALWYVNLHLLKIFAVCIFLDTVQEAANSTSPKQITIFNNMRINIKFTNFAATILLFAGFAVAAINVNTGGNAEIADFIESESKKVVQMPDTLDLNLNFQMAKDRHSRAGALFFIGERKVSIQADYVLGQLKGTVQADTSWTTGYCGMIECQAKPMPAQQRIDVAKAMVSKLLNELNGKIRGAFAEPQKDQEAKKSKKAKKTEEEEDEEDL